MTVDPIWERIHSSREFGKYPPEELVRFIATRYYAAPDRSAVRILDIGCGLGNGVWLAAREGFRACGIDASPSAIRRLKERLAAENLRAELIVGDVVTALAHAFSPETFDAVIDVTCLYSLRFEEARTTVGHVRDLLKTGGRFFSMTFDVATWGWGEGSQIETNGFTDVQAGPFRDRGFVRFYARDELDRLYGGLSMVALESTIRTIDGGSHLVKHWITECVKQSA